MAGISALHKSDGAVSLDHALKNEDGSMQMVVDGEFYGFEAIRAELSKFRRHIFGTKSGREILVHLYEEYGIECLHRLRGEFSFILWDAKTKTLFAARDRFGIKPLFYAEVPTGLSLASEVKALHAMGVPPAWDVDGFLQTLCLGGNIGGQTHFRGVKSIPAGHYLIARNGNVSVHRYWDFNFPEEDEIPERTDAEHAERFRAVLEEAVKIRLRADVPVGCYLDATIDSSSVLALMARYSIAPVQAFAPAFDHPAYDESPIAKEMAVRVGAEYTSIPIAHGTLADNFGEAVWQAETMFASAEDVVKFALRRAISDSGCDVILTGAGADDILGGLPFSSLPAWYEARESAIQKMSGVLPVDFQSKDLYERLFNNLDAAGQMDRRHPVNQSLYFQNKLSPHSNVPSLETRLPFLDHHVVEFTRSIPASQKIQGTTGKFVLREAMRDLVTPTIYSREKPPFIAPATDGPLYQMMQDTLRGSGLDALPFLNCRAVIAMLDEPAESAKDLPLMQIFSACVLAQRFGL